MYVYDIPFFANFPLFLSVVGGFLIFIIYIGKHQHKITVKWRIRKRPIRFFICSQRAIRSHFYWFGMVKGKHYTERVTWNYPFVTLVRISLLFTHTTNRGKAFWREINVSILFHGMYLKLITVTNMKKARHKNNRATLKLIPTHYACILVNTLSRLNGNWICCHVHVSKLKR